MGKKPTFVEVVFTRNVNFISLSGRSYNFRKDVPQKIDDVVLKEILELGGKLTAADIKSDDVFEPPKAVVDYMGMDDAFVYLQRKGTRESFTGTGVPKADVIKDLTGEKLAQKDVVVRWNDFKRRQYDAEQESILNPDSPAEAEAEVTGEE